MCHGQTLALGLSSIRRLLVTRAASPVIEHKFAFFFSFVFLFSSFFSIDFGGMNSFLRALYPLGQLKMSYALVSVSRDDNMIILQRILLDDLNVLVVVFLYSWYST